MPRVTLCDTVEKTKNSWDYDVCRYLFYASYQASHLCELERKGKVYRFPNTNEDGAEPETKINHLSSLIAHLSSLIPHDFHTS